MKTVKSKNIKHMHYNPETKVLEITFHSNNATYHYHDVPNHVYIGFENAKSHGEHFAQHIKTKFHGRRKKEPKK